MFSYRIYGSVSASSHSRRHTVGFKPQIPPISQILRRLLKTTVRIFSCQKLQGVANRYLLYLYNLRNLWLNPFRFLG